MGKRLWKIVVRLCWGNWVWGWYSVTLRRGERPFHLTLRYVRPAALEDLALQAYRTARRAGLTGRWRLAEVRRISA